MMLELYFRECMHAHEGSLGMRLGASDLETLNLYI